MIPFPLIISGNKQSFEIPVSWSEVSYFQAVALSKIDLNNELELASVLSGISKQLIGKMDGEVFGQLLSACLNLFTDDMPDFASLRRPKTITIRGKEYSTELNANRVLAHNMWSIQNEFRGMEDAEVSENLHRIIAHALTGQILKDKEGNATYDDDETALVAIEVGNLPAFEVYPIGSFFLQTLSIRLMARQRLLEGKLIKKNSKQKSKGFKASGLFLRWQRFAKMTGLRRIFTRQQNSV